MMLVWTECMLSLNSLEVGMSSNSMRDFVTPKERLSTPSKFNWYELIAVIITVFALGSVQSWH